MPGLDLEALLRELDVWEPCEHSPGLCLEPMQPPMPTKADLLCPTAFAKHTRHLQGRSFVASGRLGKAICMAFNRTAHGYAGEVEKWDVHLDRSSGGRIGGILSSRVLFYVVLLIMCCRL